MTHTILHDYKFGIDDKNEICIGKIKIHHNSRGTSVLGVFSKLPWITVLKLELLTWTVEI